MRFTRHKANLQIQSRSRHPEVAGWLVSRSQVESLYGQAVQAVPHPSLPQDLLNHDPLQQRDLFLQHDLFQQRYPRLKERLHSQESFLSPFLSLSLKPLNKPVLYCLVLITRGALLRLQPFHTPVPHHLHRRQLLLDLQNQPIVLCTILEAKLVLSSA